MRPTDDEIRVQLRKLRQALYHFALTDDEAPFVLNAEAVLAWVLGEPSQGLFLTTDGSDPVETDPTPPAEATLIPRRSAAWKKNGELRDDVRHAGVLAKSGLAP